MRRSVVPAPAPRGIVALARPPSCKASARLSQHRRASSHSPIVGLRLELSRKPTKYTRVNLQRSGNATVEPNRDNRKRAFADMVTVDAWHDEFTKAPKVSLHADVVFGTARVGGEEDSKVRFRLSLKRAELIVVIPETEPLAVDKKSVARRPPVQRARVTESIETSESGKAAGKLSVGFSPSGLEASATGSVEGEARFATKNRVERSETVSLFLVTPSQTAEGHYRWTIEGRMGGILKGQPWDAVKEPRLKLRDRRKDPKHGIAPTVRVELRCRREDLEISDIEIKDETLWDKARERAGYRNREIAAEAYIRERLSREGLDVRNIADKFGMLTIASVIAEPS